jgi:hypothetical protein
MTTLKEATDTKSNKTLANQLIDQGFDRTYIRSGVVHLNCSQCEALVINNTATHETRCPNVCNEQELD